MEWEGGRTRGRDRKGRKGRKGLRAGAGVKNEGEERHGCWVGAIVRDGH